MNPQSLTDAQLLKQYRLALKLGARTPNSFRVEGELRNRGLLASKLAAARREPTESHLVQLAATRIRDAACDAYNSAYQAAESQGKSSEVIHEVATMNVLVSRLRDCDPKSNVDAGMLKILAIEALPFMKYRPQIGHIAIVEYAVWREYPTLANESLIAFVVKNMKVELKPELLNGLDETPFPWARFL